MVYLHSLQGITKRRHLQKKKKINSDAYKVGTTGTRDAQEIMSLIFSINIYS